MRFLPLLCFLLIVEAALGDTTTAKPDRCSQHPEIGHCKAAMPRFYYNQTAKKCEKFTYGGCLGNENNFLSKIACHLACGEIKPI